MLRHQLGLRALQLLVLRLQRHQPVCQGGHGLRRWQVWRAQHNAGVSTEDTLHAMSMPCACHVHGGAQTAIQLAPYRDQSRGTAHLIIGLQEALGAVQAVANGVQLSNHLVLPLPAGCSRGGRPCCNRQA